MISKRQNKPGFTIPMPDGFITLSLASIGLAVAFNQIPQTVALPAAPTHATKSISILPADTNTRPAPKPCMPSGRELIVTGDSLSNKIGRVLQKISDCTKSDFNRVVNLGYDGSGLRAPKKSALGPELISAVRPGSVVVMVVGTNDVGMFRGGASPKRIEKYARDLVGVAEKIEEKGATAIMIGMRPPQKDYGIIKGDYRTGEWTSTMNAMNAAINTQAVSAGVKFIPNNITEYETDGLHLTSKGALALGREAVQVAGFTI